MKIFCDTASLAEIEEWNQHPSVAGFTTNPTLMKGHAENAWQWAKEAVALTTKPISIDGPESLWELGPNVYRKVVRMPERLTVGHLNHTAICTTEQLSRRHYKAADIISVFCGRIMDTGRNPVPILRAAQEKGCQVLWASVREPYNIVQAELIGCDIVTVPPTILRKYLDWKGRPLAQVAAETIAQFEADRAGLWC